MHDTPVPDNNTPVSDKWERGKFVRAVRRPLEPPGRARVSVVVAHSGRVEVARRGMRHWGAMRHNPGPVFPVVGHGVELSERFLETAKENLSDRVALHQGTAAIPLGDASVDVVVSGLVLNFVPDQRAALVEMARVAGKGGTIAVYVWDYAGKMEFMRYFWKRTGRSP